MKIHYFNIITNYECTNLKLLRFSHRLRIFTKQFLQKYKNQNSEFLADLKKSCHPIEERMIVLDFI